jgi:ribosomal RNA-processing protein 8
VLSLALMGSDYPLFLAEAARVLRVMGYLWIAEVRSRFVPHGDAHEDFEPFLTGLDHIGFAVVSVDLSNTLFVVWVLRRVQEARGPLESVEWPALKPCMYKRR